MRIPQPVARTAGIHEQRPRGIRAAAVPAALVVAALAAGRAAPAADAAPVADAARGEATEAAREATAARKEAASEKSLLDGKPVPKDWRLDTKMVPNDVTGQKAEQIVAKLLKPRSDSWADWTAPLEPLHHCGEPRLLPPRCVPPPPCHPAQPPHPYDLVGVAGEATAGPIYRGPCCPRTGTHDDGPLPRVHRVHDRFFDWFYMWK